MSLHLDTLSWFWANQSLLLLLKAVDIGWIDDQCLIFLFLMLSGKAANANVIMAPNLGDILCLLRFLLLLWLPNEVRETYWFCSVSYYYYSSFFFHINFVWHVSRRCLEQTLWNLVGISYAMWSCALKGWFFSKWLPLPWKCQNAKKVKNTKMIIADYSRNRNWWNLIGTTSTSNGTR